MKKIYFPLLILFLFISCKKETVAQKNTVETRITVPNGYTRTSLSINSFGTFLRSLELQPEGSPILDYRGEKIYNQSAHIAVVNYDIGHKDLQQCADAVIRLRAEYLWEQKRYTEISFHFTSGHLYSWNDHKKGMRPLVRGNNVSFEKKASFDDSYANFRNYLDYVFIYAGTISINKEMKKVYPSNEITIGDVIVTPGSPGHAVIIIDEAVNKSGDKIFLIAQSYTPAQSIHILKNKKEPTLKNWYHVSNGGNTSTARYEFYNTNVKRFK